MIRPPDALAMAARNVPGRRRGYAWFPTRAYLPGISHRIAPFCWGKVRIVTLTLVLSFLIFPPVVFGGGKTEIYSGAGMVLHLAWENSPPSEVRGVLYTRDAAFKFEGDRQGVGFRARSLYARKDRLSPYREVEGTLEIQSQDGGEKIRLEMASSLRTLTAIFRPHLDARAYNLLGTYGDSYCDVSHLVFLLVDSPHEKSGGWLSRIMRDEPDLMPVIGLFFGPRVWYSFQGDGDPSRGFVSTRLVVGDGALEGYLGNARLKARLQGGRLVYTQSDSAGEHTYELTYRPQEKLCARAVTRWSARRRMPRGKLPEPEPIQEERKDEGPKQTVTEKPGKQPAEKDQSAKPLASKEEIRDKEGAGVQKMDVTPAASLPVPFSQGEEEEVPGTRGSKDSAIPDQMEKEPLPEEVFPDETLPSWEETIPREPLPYEPNQQEPLPEDYELYPGDRDLYWPEEEGYQPLPGEEYLEEPLYLEPLEGNDLVPEPVPQGQ